MSISEHSITGRLITIEGCNGAGKTVLTERLCDLLKARGVPVVQLQEPGGTGVGRTARIFVNHHHLPPLTKTLLCQAARSAIVEQVIRPALTEGKVVILDRFIDSTWVYQHIIGGVPESLLIEVDKHIMPGLEIDLTLILDAPVEVMRARIEGSGARSLYRDQPDDYLARVKEGYLQVARRYPDRCVVLDASQRPTAVLQAALAAVGQCRDDLSSCSSATQRPHLDIYTAG